MISQYSAKRPNSMSEDERSAKRQRLDSYSPASPPPQTSDTKPFVQQPQTPPPSVHMSPSWQSTQSFTNEPRTTSGPGSVTFPTPPSISGVLPGQPRSVSGEEGTETGSHTPVVDGDPSGHRDGDAEMANTDQAAGEQGRMAEDAEHRRTDHERQNDDIMDTMPEVRPAPLLYKFHIEPIAPSRPHPTQDLIELYGLQRIQASVARKDAEGNKINKLRKSYEGKLKSLDLPGKSKAKVGNAALAGLVDPQWDVMASATETLWQQSWSLPQGELAMSDANDTLDRLNRAMAGMGKGQLPEEERKQWEDLLGLNDTKPTAASTQGKKTGAAANPLLSRTLPAQALRASAPASPGASILRPERSGKKRRYDESSYTGYQEGFDDDEGGYSTGGDSNGRRGLMAKRQRTGFESMAGRPPKVKVGGDRSP